MTLALLARVEIDPRHVIEDRWAHDMANALCRKVLELDRERLAPSALAPKGGSDYI